MYSNIRLKKKKEAVFSAVNRDEAERPHLRRRKSYVLHTHTQANPIGIARVCDNNFKYT